MARLNTAGEQSFVCNKILEVASVHRSVIDHGILNMIGNRGGVPIRWRKHAVDLGLDRLMLRGPRYSLDLAREIDGRLRRGCLFRAKHLFPNRSRLRSSATEQNPSRHSQVGDGRKWEQLFCHCKHSASSLTSMDWSQLI